MHVLTPKGDALSSFFRPKDDEIVNTEQKLKKDSNRTTEAFLGPLRTSRSKMSTVQAWEAILCPKNVQKSQKLEIKNYINVLKKIENDLKNELNPQWMACTISEYLKIHKIWPILDF